MRIGMGQRSAGLFELSRAFSLPHKITTPVAYSQRRGAAPRGRLRWSTPKLLGPGTSCSGRLRSDERTDPFLF